MVERKISGWTLLLALVGAAAAEAGRLESAPRLRTEDLAGRARISMAGQPEEISERAWPFIPSGATVRILKGRARFATDFHATVLAKAGCGFYFASHEAEESRAAALHLLSVGVCKEPLAVEVGGERLLLGPGAAVSIEWTGRRELSVRPEQGPIGLAEGRAKPASSVLVDSRSEGGELRAGDVLIIRAKNGPEFEGPASKLEETKLLRKGNNDFEARREGPALLREQRADRIIAGWRAIAQRTAEWAISKYGPPDELREDSLTWLGKGSWKRTTVHRDDVSQELPGDHWNILEQSVAYPVSSKANEALKQLRVGVRAAPEGGEITAVSESEETNFLAVNVATDFLKGERFLNDARDFYYRQRDLWNAGKSSPYLEGLASQRGSSAALRRTGDEAKR